MWLCLSDTGIGFTIFEDLLPRYGGVEDVEAGGRSWLSQHDDFLELRLLIALAKSLLRRKNRNLCGSRKAAFVTPRALESDFGLTIG